MGSLLVGLGGVVVAALASPAEGVAPLDLALLVAVVPAALPLVRATRGRTS